MRPISSPFVDRKATIRAVFSQSSEPAQLSSQHLTLIRLLRVMWVPIEEGAPGIDLWQPLLTNGPTVPSAMAALGTSDEALAVRTLAELGLLVPTFVRHGGKLAPGRYALPEAMRDYFKSADSGVSADGFFVLRKEHLLLLKAAQWCVMDGDSIGDVIDGDEECWPMPYIDGKTPYGGRSYYQMDMADILGEPYRVNKHGEVIPDDAKDERLEKLHGELLAALQVFLANATPTALL